MGKRKRLENTGTGMGISAKRIKLQDGDDLLEMDSSKVLRNFIGMEKNEATNYHNNKLKMEMNRDVKMSYQRLKRIITTDTECDLFVVVEKRHITIGWHQSGEAANAIRYILNSALGQYRKSLNGILLAVGKVGIIDKPFCIADQPCMHIDLNVNCIVFRPKQGHTYDCVVTAVDKGILSVAVDFPSIIHHETKFVTAKLHGTITFFALVKNAKKSPEIGEQVRIKFSHIEIKGSLCQVKGMIT